MICTEADLLAGRQQRLDEFMSLGKQRELLREGFPMSAKRELRDSVSGPAWLRRIVSLQEGAEERDPGREETASKERS